MNDARERLEEPLTDAEAESAFFVLIGLLDSLGCAPAATVTSKEDEGVSFSLHFSVDRARKLIAADLRTVLDALSKKAPKPKPQEIGGWSVQMVIDGLRRRDVNSFDRAATLLERGRK